MKKFNEQTTSFIQQQLLAWFKQHQRPLPWRKTYDPYQVWISEIMLQQTQVTTVLPYFERWMNALPTVKTVAEAHEDEVLKLWEGLGYYSRARNIQKAARQIVKEHGGVFPEAYEDIRALPGIGPYSAGAISSIAFNRESPIVDGNIIRLLTRLANVHENTRGTKVLKSFWARAEELIPLGKAREFNQAMMEFGALICTPKTPKCGECPLQKGCEAFKKGTVLELPNRGPRQEKIPIQVAIAVIQKSNKIFIQKRAHHGLMGGLWEFPGGKLEAKETPEQALHREIKEELGITLKNVKPVMQINHAYTKFLVNLHCFEAEFDHGDLELSAAVDHRWVEFSEINQFPFPAANVKLIKKLVQDKRQEKLF